jgi:hypothetical protein
MYLCFAERWNASPSRLEALTSTESDETFTCVRHHTLTAKTNTLVGLLFRTDPADRPTIFYHCELNRSKHRASSKRASSCLLGDGLSDTLRRGTDASWPRARNRTKRKERKIKHKVNNRGQCVRRWWSNCADFMGSFRRWITRNHNFVHYSANDANYRN